MSRRQGGSTTICRCDLIDVRDIARATAKWLATHDRRGLKRVFCEATLAIPIAEYILDSGLSFETEYHFKNFDNCEHFSGLYCDFAIFENGDHNPKIILETKYLTKPAAYDPTSIKIDMLRLSLTPSSFLKRYFLLAGELDRFPTERSEFLFEKPLFQQDQSISYDVNFSLEKEKMMLSAPKNRFFKAEFWSAQTNFPKSIRIGFQAACVAPVANANAYKVMVWSIEPRPHS